MEASAFVFLYMVQTQDVDPECDASLLLPCLLFLEVPGHFLDFLFPKKSFLVTTLQLLLVLLALTSARRLDFVQFSDRVRQDRHKEEDNFEDTPPPSEEEQELSLICRAGVFSTPSPLVEGAFSFPFGSSLPLLWSGIIVLLPLLL